MDNFTVVGARVFHGGRFGDAAAQSLALSELSTGVSYCHYYCYLL